MRSLRPHSVRIRARVGIGLLPALLLMGAWAPLPAQELVVDPAHTSASFWVRPIWLRRIGGVFPVFEGKARRNPHDASLEVELNIDVRALQMQRAAALAFAQSEDFFDSQRHPWIRFHATRIDARTLREGGVVEGMMTLREVTGRVRFTLDPGACERPAIDCAVHASAEVSRGAFGMDARRLALADTVHLEIRLRLRQAGAGVAAP